MKKFKKLLFFVLMILCVIGVIGGIGTSIYHGEYAFAIGIAVLAYTAWPKFYDYVLGLML